jgi:hypothetical protein
MGICFQGMTVMLGVAQLFLDALGKRVECDACGPEDEACGESMLCYFSCVGVFGLVVYFIFFDFGDAGICDDVDFVVGEFTFCVVGDFLVVGVEDMRLTLNNVDGNLFS